MEFSIEDLYEEIEFNPLAPNEDQEFSGELFYGIFASLYFRFNLFLSGKSSSKYLGPQKDTLSPFKYTVEVLPGWMMLTGMNRFRFYLDDKTWPIPMEGHAKVWEDACQDPIMSFG